MSRFGRSGPPPIRDTYSLLVLNITFRTTADDLSPLFEKYGDVVDIYIPRDRRTGDSRGFAFVRYKYEDEAQKAVDRLDGRVVDGREIMVQFAKYGPNAERIHKGRIMETVPKSRGRSRSRSPRRGYRDDYRERDNYRRRSRSRDRYGRDRYKEKDYRRRSRSRSYTPDDYRRRGRDSVSPARRSPSRSYSPDDYRKRGKHSQLPACRSPICRLHAEAPAFHPHAEAPPFRRHAEAPVFHLHAEALVALLAGHHLLKRDLLSSTMMSLGALVALPHKSEYRENTSNI
uniref:RRM domain-containing protein n=1 Tax=Oryza brachyantha TaxID=4533 RepID=J3MN39_ORYBR